MSCVILLMRLGCFPSLLLKINDIRQGSSLLFRIDEMQEKPLIFKGFSFLLSEIIQKFYSERYFPMMNRVYNSWKQEGRHEKNK